MRGRRSSCCSLPKRDLRLQGCRSVSTPWPRGHLVCRSTSPARFGLPAPARAVMQAQLLEKSVRLRPTATQHSILIIDDDEAMAEALATRLAQQGFQTLTAFQGQQ